MRAAADVEMGRGGVVGGARGFAQSGWCGCRTPSWLRHAGRHLAEGRDPIEAARLAGVGRGRDDISVARRIRRHWRRCLRYQRMLAAVAPGYDVEAEAEIPEPQTALADALEQSRFAHLFRS